VSQLWLLAGQSVEERGDLVDVICAELGSELACSRDATAVSGPRPGRCGNQVHSGDIPPPGS